MGIRPAPLGWGPFCWTGGVGIVTLSPRAGRLRGMKRGPPLTKSAGGRGKAVAGEAGRTGRTVGRGWTVLGAGGYWEARCRGPMKGWGGAPGAPEGGLGPPGGQKLRGRGMIPRGPWPR